MSLMIHGQYSQLHTLPVWEPWGLCAAAFLSVAVRSLVQPITFIVKVLAAALVTGTQHYQLAVLS